MPNPGSEGMRLQIEQKYVSAHDIYGLSEVCGPGVAFDYRFKHGLVCEDNFIIEIVDPVTVNLAGTVKWARLSSLVLRRKRPLIRYNTRDISSLTS